jgi:hypothetical protein
MSYHNLTNEEIVFLYKVAQSITRQYEEVYKAKVLQQRVPTEMGVINVETPIPEELIDEMLQGKHYQFMKSIRDKLQTLTELIVEAQPEVMDTIMSIFQTDKKE